MKLLRVTFGPGRADVVGANLAGVCDYCDCRDLGPIKELLVDHEQARATLLAFEPGAPTPTPEVLGALDDLVKHIETEEHDLFPASRMILDDAGWHDVQVAHRRADVQAAAVPVGGEA